MRSVIQQYNKRSEQNEQTHMVDIRAARLRRWCFPGGGLHTRGFDGVCPEPFESHRSL